MLSNIYSKSFLQSSPHMRLISKTILFDRFLPILNEAVSSKTPIEFLDLVQGVTMDFVSAYLFGLTNGTNLLQDPPYRQRLLQLYHSRKQYEFYHQEIPNLVSWLKVLGINLIPKWCGEANDALDAWGLDMCDKAEQSLGSAELQVEPVVYKHLKQALSRQPPATKGGSKENLKHERIEIACELYDQLTAGFETSAIALTYLLWEMSQHPDLQKELREELLTLEPKILYPRPSISVGLPSSKSIDSLPLLEAIVTETLRLHAPIPGIQPRVTPSPSCSLAGYNDIPANIRVNAQAYSLHRNPDVFPAPETWQPKRWLKDSNLSSDIEEMRRWFWAFGSGGRIPQADALSEIKLVVATIYTNFKTSIIDDTGIEAIDAYTVKPEGEKLVLKFDSV
ncbi:hypothetical protein EYZ11_008820 [Aspergillus tanneri]|uniref:Cytochrome P450 n=1 Tax=Aspergillus tanneri TaxID=1220188 RepID=A0A4S3JBN1_9EURO|nr:hypothetical protein EYZ11_008820 [Aspergillus tanneri]